MRPHAVYKSMPSLLVRDSTSVGLWDLAGGLNRFRRGGWEGEGGKLI